MTIPLPVLQFAMVDSLDGGITPAEPISWTERSEEWVIVYRDGRKIRHAKTEPRPAKIDSPIEGGPKASRVKVTQRKKPGANND